MERRKEANTQVVKEDWHKEDQTYSNDLFAIAIAHNANFYLIPMLDWNIFFYYEPFFYALLAYRFNSFGRFSLILKWDNLYFHHSQNLLANNIVFNVSCKLIQAIVV
jgi:ABC-type polysaccharide transport system permease subunit